MSPLVALHKSCDCNKSAFYFLSKRSVAFPTQVWQLLQLLVSAELRRSETITRQARDHPAALIGAIGFQTFDIFCRLQFLNLQDSTLSVISSLIKLLKNVQQRRCLQLISPK